jgi:hypothetical protein
VWAGSGKVREYRSSSSLVNSFGVVEASGWLIAAERGIRACEVDYATV